MNWIIRHLDDFTTWLVINHARHMNTVRQFLARQERNRMQHEHRHQVKQRKRRRAVEKVQVQAKQETRELLADHRQWNASRQTFGGKGGVRHFG